MSQSKSKETKVVPEEDRIKVSDLCLRCVILLLLLSLLFSLTLSLSPHMNHRRERHDIPLIVQTCVDEVERRGMSEVGVYRVAGVLRDVQELRQAFDTGKTT